MNTIEQLIATTVTQALTNFFANQHAQAPVAQAPAAPAVSAPAFAPPVAPAVVAAPIFTPPVAAPVFTPPAPQAAPAPTAPVGNPITDQASLVAYVMDAYKTMGQPKGGQIQGIINNCQVQSINECRPEHYAYIYQCVEQLKAA